MGKHNRPDDITTTDRCAPADPHADPLAVRVSPTWRGEASAREHLGSSRIVTFEIADRPDYRAAKQALHDRLMADLGDNVGLKLTLETDSFSEFFVTDHDGEHIGFATIEEVKHDRIS
ncbi:hypothetical protein HOS75_gp035 [Gordonia phage SteveFrench]|uniref:Uncharacterized protein n=2 Tax=Montyvirus stevefrench TaxID=2734258 RepID=A0A890V5Q9_9CAUD|nr:hypothetical protein HOS75_gp035 [Gordonia phage SteveFrench]AUV60695.1 hypothetical protein SEA_STEVEFRENCH_93 [Gordonia phage SteveFrench]QRI45678.1 hypothetical protein SEA_ROYALG_94 [Gordonia phage RoyalG]